MDVDFIFDFGSPNAYLAHKVLPEIAERTGARFVYVPVLLGGVFKTTGNRSPVETYAGVKNKLDYERREMERFVKRHALSQFRFNPHFPINTLMIMRGALVAEREGRLAPYAEAVFTAVWEDEKKMDDSAVIAAVLDAADFDGRALLESAGDPDIKAQLAANTEKAVARGVFGAPSFFVAGELFFGKDRLAQVEEEIRRHG